MKIQSRPVSLLFLAAWAGVVPLAHASTPSTPSTSVTAPAPRQLKMGEFKQAFERAMKINAKEEMAKLIRQYNEEAILRILAILELVSSQQGNDAMLEELNHLRVAWKSTIKSGFVDEVEKYFSLLHPSARSERAQYVRAYQIASRDLDTARTERDLPKLNMLSSRFEGLAAQLESVGDLYYAGHCWGNAVAANHPDNVGVDADLGKLADLLGEFVRTREALDLKDYLYSQNKTAYIQLSAQGFGKNAAAVAAGDEATPGAESGGPGPGEAGGTTGAPSLVPAGSQPSGPTVESVMTFETVPDLRTYERPNYNADDIYQMWMAMDLRAKPSTFELPRVADAPVVHRIGSNEFRLDTDWDGKGDQEIPVTGNVNLIQFDIGKGDSKRPWAILTTVGAGNDFYQGISVNLAPNDQSVLIYYASASSVVGEIAGEAVRVIDEDLDGIYGNPSRTFGWMGLTPDHFQPEMDSIVIGERSDRAAPWSEFIQLKSGWVQLATSDFGRRIKATPFDLPTGKLKLKFGGPAPKWLIVQGTGRFKDCLFDIAGAGSKGAEVPAGTYKLYYGEVRKGSKRQEAKTLILAGKSTQTWTVAEGETETIELGKPFSFDFQVEQDDALARVPGNTVAVIGRAGERYERPWNCVSRPTMSIREAGTKKGTKPKNMDFIVGTDQLYKVGWEWAWSPLDTVVKKGGGDGTVEVQLVEKRNKLFGSVESDWKK